MTKLRAPSPKRSWRKCRARPRQDRKIVAADERRSAYVIVWEFRIRQGEETEFVKHYGPDGTWVRFFQRGEGYIRTELVRDVADRERFLTLDYWQSQGEFKRFREQNRAEYERLDKEFEKLTEAETRLGSFWLGIQS